jgi:hypothetical protein
MSTTGRRRRTTNNNNKKKKDEEDRRFIALGWELSRIINKGKCPLVDLESLDDSLYKSVKEREDSLH